LSGFISGEFRLAGCGGKNFFKQHALSRVHIVAPVTDRIIHAEAFLEVPPDSAFRYFSDNERLRSWLAVQAELKPKLAALTKLWVA